MKALQNSSTFYAARTFDGVIDLATEIGMLHTTHYYNMSYICLRDVAGPCSSFADVCIRSTTCTCFVSTSLVQQDLPSRDRLAYQPRAPRIA